MKKSFTLAEVLIVLGIIGLIADMTIPTLISKTQDKIAVTQVKKIYSILEQAFGMSASKDGEPENWGLTAGLWGPSDDTMRTFAEKFANELNVAENCISNVGPSGTVGCFPNLTIKNLDGTNFSNLYTNVNTPKIKLTNGMNIYFGGSGVVEGVNACKNSEGTTKLLNNLCPVHIAVDINGEKKPNTRGKDMFYFSISNYGIVPMGLKDNGPSLTECKRPNPSGIECTAWVLFAENLDYLYCDDLSWTGKRKCGDK